MPCFTSNITEFKSFIPAPIYILENNKLNFIEKCVYLELLTRTRLSQMNVSTSVEKTKWSNEKNEIYIYYPIKDLAKKMGRGESAIKSALNSLEKEGLLRRERQGQGKANKLYLQYPEGECFEKSEKFTFKKGEKVNVNNHKTDFQTGGKPTGNNSNMNYINMNKRKRLANEKNSANIKSERWGRVF